MPPALGVAVGVAGLAMSAGSMIMGQKASDEQRLAVEKAGREAYAIEVQKEFISVEDRMIELMQTFGGVDSAVAGAGLEAGGSIANMARSRAFETAKRDLAAIRFNTIAAGVRAGVIDKSELEAERGRPVVVNARNGRIVIPKTESMKLAGKYVKSNVSRDLAIGIEDTFGLAPGTY